MEAVSAAVSKFKSVGIRTSRDSWMQRRHDVWLANEFYRCNTSEDLRTQLKTQGASPAETHESRFFTDPPKQLHSHTVHRQRLQATETCSNVAILTGVASRSIASVPALSCRLHNRVVVAAHGQQNVAWLAWAAARKRYIPRTVTPELQHMCTVLRLCVCVCVCVCLCMTGVRACFLVRSSGPRVGVFASS